jgi:exodeoxyribonuclease X
MRIQDATFVVIDTETTGLDCAKDKLVEIAAVAIQQYQGIVGMWATLINPGVPIPPEVSAVHYLTAADVADAPTLSIAESGLNRFWCLADSGPLVAHNAAFDAGFIDPSVLGYTAPADWLCTQRLARHVWPDAPTYKNQGLRFWRRLKVDTFGVLPHRALGDALVTAALLDDLLGSSEFAELGIATVEDLRALSASPVRFTTWPKGKHYGKPLDTDLGYVRWALGPSGMTDMDADLRFSLSEVLGRK